MLTHEVKEGLPPFLYAAKQRLPVGSRTGVTGNHTHVHTLTHRSTRGETYAHKTHAWAHKDRHIPGQELRGRQR